MLCDKRVPLGLKGKVYRMVVRPAVLYGSECWPLKKTQVQRLTVAEMDDKVDVWLYEDRQNEEWSYQGLS